MVCASLLVEKTESIRCSDELNGNVEKTEGIRCLLIPKLIPKGAIRGRNGKRRNRVAVMQKYSDCDVEI